MTTSPAQPRTAIFVCVHKGASSFIARAFAEAAEEVFPELCVVNVGNQVDEGDLGYGDIPVPRSGAVFVRVYPRNYHELVDEKPEPGRPRLDGTKLVVLRRDPRDAAVSLYFARAFSHTPPKDSEDRFLENRATLQEVGPKRGVRRSAKMAMREFHEVDEILSARPDALLTTYEHLVTDYRGWVDEVGEYLGWSLDERTEMFRRTRGSFDLPTFVDPKQHVRRITPGNWLEYDHELFRAKFEELGGDAMRAAGYSWPA